MAVTVPTVALFALPVETTGWDEEQVHVHARVRRASEAPGNIDVASLNYVDAVSLGPLAACPKLPQLPRSEAIEAQPRTYDNNNEKVISVATDLVVSPHARSLWYVAVFFTPPPNHRPTMNHRLTIEVEMALEGASINFQNCTGGCLERHRRGMLLTGEAAKAPTVAEAYPMLQQLRLLYPRRAFAALRFADRAQEEGQSTVKWNRYEKACRLLALEVGDCYAMMAINAADPRHSAVDKVAANLHRMQHALADLHIHNARCVSWPSLLCVTISVEDRSVTGCDYPVSGAKTGISRCTALNPG